MTVESKLRIIITTSLLHISNHPIVFLMSLNIILSIRMYICKFSILPAVWYGADNSYTT